MSRANVERRHAMLVQRKALREARPALRLMLAAAATGLVLVTIFALRARLWWAFDLFSHFRLHYVAAALVLVVPALAVRAFGSAAALALVALVHGWAIKDLWLDGSAGAAPMGVPLRVVSANVLNNNSNPEKVLELVRASDADLVVLVDARRDSWQSVLSDIGALYPYRAPEGWRDGGRVTLFSRHPIVHAGLVHPSQDQRPFLVAKIAVGDQTLQVVGVHPSSPSPKDATDSHRRNLQLSHIAARIDESPKRPVIVAGDFNTTPWSPHFQDLLAAAGLRNAALGHGYIATWPRWLGPLGIPLDHVLVKGPIAVADIEQGPPIGSDHYPVVADLRLLER